MSSSLRIVVTGASGKIGARLVETLVSRGHRPVGLDLVAPTNPVAPFVQIDLRDREKLESILREADAICHLGEVPYMKKGIAAEHLFAHNCAAGSNILQTAADVKLKRIVYVSSCQVYGLWGPKFENITQPPALPMDETAPLQPQDAYALGKVAVESYARMLARQNPGLSIAAIRFPWVWNDRDAAFAREKRAGRATLLEGMNTYLHLDDATELLSLALESDRTGFEAYHAVADDIWCARPAREILTDRFGAAVKLPSDWPDFRSPVSTEKARQHFGWSPKFRITDPV